MSEKTLELENQMDTEKSVREVSRPTFAPQVDIYEFNNEVVLEADMPGVGADQVDITIEKNILTIGGSVDDETVDDLRKFFSEYAVGKYKRTFALSDEVDTERIQATVNNGVVKLNLPKVEQARIKKITVQSTS